MWHCEIVKLWNSAMAKLWNCEIANSINCEIVKLRNCTKLWNCEYNKNCQFHVNSNSFQSKQPTLCLDYELETPLTHPCVSNVYECWYRSCVQVDRRRVSRTRGNRWLAVTAWLSHPSSAARAGRKYLAGLIPGHSSSTSTSREQCTHNTGALLETYPAL